MSTTYLKIKIKSLADESKTIRAEEKKLITAKQGPSMTRQGLYLHRVNDVRSESRAALIAYGYLRGRAYRQIEAKCHIKPDWKRASKLAEKYHPAQFDPKDFIAWQDEGFEIKKAA